MKICLAVLDEAGTVPMTGMDQVIRMNAEAIVAAGGSVAVLMPDRPVLREALSQFTIEFYRIPPGSPRRPRLRGFASALRALRRAAPDVVHFHAPAYRWGWDVVLAANALRLPLVRTEHNPVMSTPGRFERAAMQLLDLRVRACVYVSAGNQRRFEAAFPWRIGRGDVIPNTIDPTRLAPPRPSNETIALAKDLCGLTAPTPLAVLVGRGVGIAGAQARRPLGPVFEALHHLDAIAPENGWHLAVIGDGDIPRAEAEAARLGLAGRVHFLGTRPDAHAIIASSDLLVSASHYEGCSITFLEAWYAGVPVLATRVDGIEDIAGAARVQDLTAPHGDTAAFAVRWAQALDQASPFRRANAYATRIVRDPGARNDADARLLQIYERVSAASAAVASPVPG